MTDEHQALNFTINSPGWSLIKQWAADRQKENMAKLLDPAKQRGELMPDDYLRGYIRALIDFAKWPQEEVEQALIDEQNEQRMVEDQAHYEQLAELGHTFGDRLTEEALSG